MLLKTVTNDQNGEKFPINLPKQYTHNINMNLLVKTKLYELNNVYHKQEIISIKHSKKYKT